MSRPRLPRFLYGVVQVPVPRVNIVIGLAGVVLAFAGNVLGEPIMVAVGIGALSVLPFACGLHWLTEWRVKRQFRNAPVSVDLVQGEEGRVAFVTKLSGEMVTVEIPEDYHPSQDGGRWIMDQVAPELTTLLIKEEDEEDLGQEAP